ncbi:MAG TPA: NADP(H)-dependent aldo-keto reductase [Plasticicumulans sp.]|nr:NADP(H)-dependent aldo-keto reductase [Plasticicumulans sp.]
MRTVTLGCTDLVVSRACLGTMTWGEQNTEAEARAQLDFATARGVNFIDTAEMYPVPPRAETQGRTEQYLGNWLAAQPGRRNRLVIASKVAGASRGIDWLRPGPLRLDRANVLAACEASLKRLRTDHLDLYQVHWPDRPTNMFGQLGYRVDDTPAVPVEETLAALAELVQAGKVRHVGISNETPWGLMRYLRAAETPGLPRIASIQNPYSLLNRSFEIGLAEMSWREQVPLLAYSPLAMGVLSGKYLDGARPAGARLSRFERFTRYSQPEAEAPTRAYVGLARQHGLDPAAMALAWVDRQPWVGATIIGATSLAQLEADLAAFDTPLDAAVCAAIDAIHQRQPNPCP